MQKACRYAKNNILCSLVVIVLAACSPQQANVEGIEASEYTIAANLESVRELDFNDQADFELAGRGLIAREDDLVIYSEDGEVLWRPSDYAFLESNAVNEVHPGLARQSALNNIHGLFEVTKGVYQVRGYDLANMAIIEGKTGWIIVDPLTTRETATAAMALVEKALGNKPVSAIVFSHSHVDHFGGSLAFEDILDAVPIIAPAHFMHEATTENVLAGTTMGRRSIYMYGQDLPRSRYGHVGSGLGQSPAMGSIGIAEPTLDITHTGQTEIIDGIEFVFQYTPESEAPSEATFYLPKHKAFFGADILSKSMLNLYTLRGAKVRDALAWSGYIEEARVMFSDAEVYFAGHHWPIWGKTEIDEFLRKQRDLYKYIHDQTLRLAYKGRTPIEIADELTLPESLNSEFYNRGYYGSLKHNVRAVYQFYFGWYDNNPVNLNRLPPEKVAARYVDAIGGEERVLEIAKEAIDTGDYRWAAELLNHLVFAEGSSQAKTMLAYTYRQLGYQSESGPWRNNYLTGAKELLEGPGSPGVDVKKARDMLKFTPVQNFFDAMAAQLHGPDAEGVDIAITVHFSDLDKGFILWIENAVLHHKSVDLADSGEATDATITITHAMFLDVILGQLNPIDLLSSDDISFSGSRLKLLEFFSLQDRATEAFAIVEP